VTHQGCLNEVIIIIAILHLSTSKQVIQFLQASVHCLDGFGQNGLLQMCSLLSRGLCKLLLQQLLLFCGRFSLHTLSKLLEKSLHGQLNTIGSTQAY
jgi:hypothetical protein